MLQFIGRWRVHSCWVLCACSGVTSPKAPGLDVSFRVNLSHCCQNTFKIGWFRTAIFDSTSLTNKAKSAPLRYFGGLSWQNFSVGHISARSCLDRLSWKPQFFRNQLPGLTLIMLHRLYYRQAGALFAAAASKIFSWPSIWVSYSLRQRISTESYSFRWCNHSGNVTRNQLLNCGSKAATTNSPLICMIGIMEFIIEPRTSVRCHLHYPGWKSTATVCWAIRLFLC